MLSAYEYFKTYFGMNSSDEGVTAIEYGILAALIAVAIIGAVLAVQGGLNTTFNRVATELGGTASTS